MKVFLILMIVSGHINLQREYEMPSWEKCLQSIKEGQFKTASPSGKEAIATFCIERPAHEP